MSKVTKERREELREDCDRVDRINGDFARLTTNELRTLLDLADERDRYRALLEDVRGSLPAAGIPQSDGIWVPYTNDEWTLLCRRTDKIDAALETD